MNIEQIDHLSLIKISGQDAETFLQGQLTSDVTSLAGQWQYAGYCNPKGRLLALLQIWRQEQDFYALISNDLLEATTKRLRMYVMRSKVSIEELDEWEAIGILERNSSKDILEELALATPQLDLSAYRHGDLVHSPSFSALIINQRALIVRKVTGEPVANNIESGPRWCEADIKEGLPQVNATTAEQFIPQMLNLDLLGGISFKKGCYTGQEIVARMHYLGKLKQRMFSCDISPGSESGTKAIAGDKVYADPAHEKTVGTLVSVDPVNQKALAVLRLDSLDKHLELNGGDQVKLLAPQAYELA